MSRPVPFTKASLRRAADVAAEKGLRVVIHPDGTLTLESQEQKPQSPQPQTVEPDSEVVL